MDMASILSEMENDMLKDIGLMDSLMVKVKKNKKMAIYTKELI